MYTVYCLSKGKHAYIGMTKDLDRRLAVHKTRVHTMNNRMYLTIHSLGGLDAMKVNVINTFKSFDEAAEMEKHLIATLQPSLNTHNVHLYEQ
jgi:predicted GIY-YIG superfamily endonuclease